VQVIFHLFFGVVLGIGAAADNVFCKGPVNWALCWKYSLVLLLTQFLPLFTHPGGFYSGLAVHLLVVAMANNITLNSFRLSHITERTSCQHYDATSVDGVDWGEHQLRTTCNFRTCLLSISGMLDMQIEHHLFPSLTYAQQAQIRDVVKSTAQEFDIPYHDFSGWTHGFLCHLGYLNHLGWSLESKINQNVQKSHVD
jgi:linoleoyl-CoA desaturase